MKICFAAGVGFGEWCGVSESVFMLAKKLNSKSIDVTVVTAGKSGLYLRLIQDERIKLNTACVSFDSMILKRLRKASIFEKIIFLLGLLTANLRFLWVLIRNRPDYVYIADIAAVPWAIVGSKLLCIKIVFAVRGEPQGGLLWKIALRHSEQIALLSSDLKRLLLMRHPSVSDAKCVVIPNAVEQPAEHSFNTSVSVKTIGYVGMFNSVKNQLHFVTEVLPLIRASFPVDVLFMGGVKGHENIAYMNDCISAARNVKNMQIKFLGFVNNKDEIYKNIDVLALCSVTEGQSRALLEAISYQVPFVTYDVPSADDLVVDSGAGILVRDRDPVLMAEEISGLIENTQKYLKLKSAGHSYILQHNIDHVVDRYIVEVFK